MDRQWAQVQLERRTSNLPAKHRKIENTVSMYFNICILIYLHVRLHVCVHLWLGELGGSKSQPLDSFFGCHLHVFEMRSLTGLELAHAAQLADQQAQGPT